MPTLSRAISFRKRGRADGEAGVIAGDNGIRSRLSSVRDKFSTPLSSRVRSVKAFRSKTGHREELPACGAEPTQPTAPTADSIQASAPCADSIQATAPSATSTQPPSRQRSSPWPEPLETSPETISQEFFPQPQSTKVDDTAVLYSPLGFHTLWRRESDGRSPHPGPLVSRHGLRVNEAGLLARIRTQTTTSEGEPAVRIDSMMPSHKKSQSTTPKTSSTAARSSERFDAADTRVTFNRPLWLQEATMLALSLQNELPPVDPDPVVHDWVADQQQRWASNSAARDFAADSNATAMPSDSSLDRDESVQEEMSRRMAAFDSSLKRINDHTTKMLTMMRQHLATQTLNLDTSISIATAFSEVELSVKTLQEHRHTNYEVFTSRASLKDRTAFLKLQHRLSRPKFRQFSEALGKLVDQFEKILLGDDETKRRSCMICTEDKLIKDFPLDPPTMACKHQMNTCTACLQTWVSTNLDSQGLSALHCSECTNELSHDDIRRCAAKDTFAKYDALTTRNALSSDPTFAWCLSPNCSSGQLRPDALNHFMRCPDCNYEQCLHHRTAWHRGSTCREIDDKHAAAAQKEERESLAKIASTTKTCPNAQCGWKIEKSYGCDAMRCVKCGQYFCWQCLAPRQRIVELGDAGHDRKCALYRSKKEIGFPFNVHLA